MEILRTLERHYRDMQDTEFTVEEGRLYMLQTRNAKRPAQAAVQVRGRRGRGGPADARAGAGDDRPRVARRAAAPDVRPAGRVRGARDRRQRVAGRRQGHHRVHGGGRGGGRRGGARRDPRAPVHRRRGRRRLPCREGDPDLRGRQGLARGAGRARDGHAGGRRRRRGRDRPEDEDDHGRRDGAARGRSDRDRRHQGLGHGRRRAAGRGSRRRELRDRARVGR